MTDDDLLTDVDAWFVSDPVAKEVRRESRSKASELDGGSIPPPSAVRLSDSRWWAGFGASRANDERVTTDGGSE